MTIFTFLQHIQQAQLTTTVYCLVSAQPPVLFLGFIKHLVAQSYYVQTLDLASLEDDAFEAQLSMSFLGSVNYFWVTGYHDLDAKRKKKITALCERYLGVNVIIMAVDTPSKHESILSLELPDRLNAQQAQDILASMNASPNALALLKHYFARRQSLPIDGLMVLAEYAIVVGVRSKEFLDAWLDYLIEPDFSLFMLATYFFSIRRLE